MKAGAFTPAIHATRVAAHAASVRSMKAGAFTPAILEGAPGSDRAFPSLNEGRGFHPRDPRVCSVRTATVIVERSMKAGAFTPAIHPVALGRTPRWLRAAQ